MRSYEDILSDINSNLCEYHHTLSQLSMVRQEEILLSMKCSDIFRNICLLDAEAHAHPSHMGTK